MRTNQHKQWRWQVYPQCKRYAAQLARWGGSLLAIALLLLSSNLVFAQDAATDDNANSHKVFLPALSLNNDALSGEAPLRPEEYDSQQEPVLDEQANSGRTFCPTFVKVSNQSSYTINVYWVDLFGNELFYKKLTSGSYYWQTTLLGLRWRVRSSSGVLLKDFVVNTCLLMYVTISNSNFPPTATPTKTPLPPTATPTKTPVAPTATSTPVPSTVTPTNTPLPLPANLGNQVWFDLNGNGTQQIDEPYVPNITVQLLQGCTDDIVLDTQITDGNGFYTFYGLTPGQYRVRFSNLPLGYQFTLKDVGAADNVDSDVNPDGTTDCITLASADDNSFTDAGIVTVNGGANSISGVAWYDANKDGIRTGGEAPVLDVLLILYNSCSSSTIFATQVTDDNGFYTFTTLPAGEYRLEAVQDAGFPISPKDQALDTIDSDFDPATHQSDCISLTAGGALSFDVGFYPVN